MMAIPAPPHWPWPVRQLLFLALFVLTHALGILAASALVYALNPEGLIGGLESEPPSLLLVAMMGSLPATLLTLFLWRRLENGSWKELGLGSPGERLPALLAGFVGGLSLAGLIAAPAIAGGWSGRVWLPEGAGGLVRTVGLCLPGFLLVGVSEEVAFRGFLYRGLARHVGPTAALGVSSLLFAALHANNPNLTPLGALNIGLAGLLLGGVARASAHLAAPIGLHAGWNFALAALVGLPVSGVSTAGLIRIPLSTPAWWTGGAFGPEGSVAATLVLTAALLLVRRGWIRQESCGPAGSAPRSAPADDPVDQDDDGGQKQQG